MKCFFEQELTMCIYGRCSELHILTNQKMIYVDQQHILTNQTV